MSSLLSADIATTPHLNAAIDVVPVLDSAVVTQLATTASVDVPALLSSDVLTTVLLAGIPVFNYKFGDQAFADTVLLLSDGFQLELDSDNLILGDYTPEFLESIGR
jgi:hypothetical protein